MPADAKRKLSSWENVTPGNTAYIDLPIDRDYATIDIKATALLSGSAITDAKQLISKIRLIANGVTFREFTPDQLRQINGVNGVKAGQYNPQNLLYLRIHGREDWLWNGANALMLNTSGITTLRIEVDLISTNITQPALAGTYSFTPKRQLAPGTNVVRKVRVRRVDFAATGMKDFRNLTFKGQLKRLHLEGSAVTDAKFEVSNAPIFDMSREEQVLLLERNEMVPTSGFFVVPFDETQEIDAGLPAAGLAEGVLFITVNATGGVNIIEEYFEPIA